MVEYTGGSTGVSLALVCAVKRYPLHIVTSDAFAREKLDHMRIARRASCTLVPSDGGRMTRAADARHDRGGARHRRADRRLLDRPAEQPRPARRPITPMADEIWAQTGGRDRRLRAERRHRRVAARHRRRRCARRSRRIRIVAVEPAESPVLSGGPAGRAQDRRHRRRLRRAAVARRTSPTGSSRSRPRRRRPWRCAWRARKACSPAPRPAPTSSPRCAWPSELGPDATVVTVMCDTGMKYLSTALYSGRA